MVSRCVAGCHSNIGPTVKIMFTPSLTFSTDKNNGQIGNMGGWENAQRAKDLQYPQLISQEV